MPTEAEILEALKSVIDPELGVNVVDLGLVYGVAVEGEVVRIEMTMTTPACPMGGYIVEESENELMRAFPGLRDVQVDLVFEPPWHPERMSPAAKAQLGWTGG